MLCFNSNGDSATPSSTSIAAQHQDRVFSRSSSVQTSTSAADSPNHTIDLRGEYNRYTQTNSFNTIWSKIHHHHHHSDEQTLTLTLAPGLIDSILHPNRSSIEETLTSARFTPLTRLVSDFLESSEHTSHLFLSLSRAVDLAQSIYAPIGDLLEILAHDQLSPSQCDYAFDTFQEFDKTSNPFEAADFNSIRSCFVELKPQLDSRLSDARKRHKFLRVVTRSSACCLIASTAAVAVTGVVIAAHAIVMLAMAGPGMCCGGGDLLSTRRRKLREHIAKVDAAARETYVLNNNLDTIERLVARLHANVESDKVLVRLVLERGRGKGQKHSIEEVLRHLRKNYTSFMKRVRDLDKHIVLCLAAVNRARALLVQQIHC